MSQLMQRLGDYWWPRMSSEPCLESCPHKYVTYYENTIIVIAMVLL